MFGLGELLSNILGTGMLGFMGWAAVSKIRSAKGRLDNRQESYIKLAAACTKEGLEFFPAILTKLGVGKWKEAYEEANKALDMLKSDEERNRHFDAMLVKRVPSMLADANRRMLLVEAYETYRKGNPMVAAKIKAALEAGDIVTTLQEKVVILEGEAANVETPEVKAAVVAEKLAALEAKVNGGNGTATPSVEGQLVVLESKVEELAQKSNGPTLEEQQAIVNQKLDALAAMVNGNKAVSATSKPAA